MDIVANSKVTQDYILDDCVEVVETAIGEITYVPNEITMLKSKSLSPELKERLGLIMENRPASPASGDNPNRYRQSLSEIKADAETAIDALDAEVKASEEKPE